MTKGFTPTPQQRQGATGAQNMKSSEASLCLVWGFTLIELLVYVALFCLLITAVISFVYLDMKSDVKAKVMRETLNNASRAMEIMVYETKEAKSIYTPTTANSQLSLETVKHLPDGEETSFVDFYISNARLYFKRESGDPVAITSDNVEISSLTFTRIVSGTIPSVRIDLTVSYKNPTGRSEYQSQVSLSSAASLRSY
jgi:type II secretory pathway pseudopilin PulG